MAEAIYLVQKNAGPGQHVVNGLFAALINADNGGTDAVIMAAADAQAVAAGHAIPSPYFDVAPVLITAASGALNDNHDCFLMTATDQPDITKVEG